MRWLAFLLCFFLACSESGGSQGSGGHGGTGRGGAGGAGGDGEGGIGIVGSGSGTDCNNTAECDDHDPCTTDYCLEGKCASYPGDGTRCDGTCLCLPCDATATDCHAGFCQAGACVDRTPVRCQLTSGQIYSGCNGNLELGTTISWGSLGEHCNGAANDVGYCATGTKCTVTTRTTTQIGECL